MFSVASRNLRAPIASVNQHFSGTVKLASVPSFAALPGSTQVMSSNGLAGFCGSAPCAGPDGVALLASAVAGCADAGAASARTTPASKDSRAGVTDTVISRGEGRRGRRCWVRDRDCRGGGTPETSVTGLRLRRNWAGCNAQGSAEFIGRVSLARLSGFRATQTARRSSSRGSSMSSTQSPCSSLNAQRCGCGDARWSSGERRTRPCATQAVPSGSGNAKGGSHQWAPVCSLDLCTEFAVAREGIEPPTRGFLGRVISRRTGRSPLGRGSSRRAGLFSLSARVPQSLWSVLGWQNLDRPQPAGREYHRKGYASIAGPGSTRRWLVADPDEFAVRSRLLALVHASGPQDKRANL